MCFAENQPLFDLSVDTFRHWISLQSALHFVNYNGTLSPLALPTFLMTIDDTGHYDVGAISPEDRDAVLEGKPDALSVLAKAHANGDWIYVATAGTGAEIAEDIREHPLMTMLCIDGVGIVGAIADFIEHPTGVWMLEPWKSIDIAQLESPWLSAVRSLVAG